MIIGETICAENGNDTVVYSPWFPRQGNAATFTIELIATDNTKVVTKVQTKNAEDADPAAGGGLATKTSPAGNFEISSASTTTSSRWKDFKELVRFEYTVDRTTSGVGFAHYRMLNPAWETN